MSTYTDKTDPDAWFEHEFNPYSAVVDYANAPPRGMTNAPMNLVLRKVLCKDLCEYGLVLQAPHWEGGFGRTSSSAPTSPSQSQYTATRRLARTFSSRSQLMSSYTENLRSGQTLKKGSIFSRSAPAIGVVSQEEGAAAHPDWHQYHPFPHTLRPIDRRGPLLKTPSAASTEKKASRSVHFAEDAQKTLTEHLEKNYQGSPVNTEFIKTPSHEKAITLGKNMSLDASKGKRPNEPGHAKDGKHSGKDGGHDDKDGKKKHNAEEHEACVDNTELDNRMRSLRGNSQLHRAAVADRFRFGASAEAGDPMVLNAASLSQANPGSWSSDAAFLNKFHNSAIRIVHPSGLEVLKEPKVKKKKKKKLQDDDSDLKMTVGGGEFVARYPVDQALIKLRKVKKQTFPESEVAAVVGPTKEEIAAATANKLKTELGISLLGKVRAATIDVKAEQELAVAQSGY